MLKNKNKIIEAFAALALIKIGYIQEPFSKEWLKDRPDLQIGSVGIEVTEALSTCQGEKRKVEEEMSACKTIEQLDEYKNMQKRPDKYAFEHLRIPGTDRVLTGTGGGYDEERMLNLITNSILKKSNKHQEYPCSERFTMHGLFVFAKDLMPSQQLNNDALQMAVNNSVFDKAFILQPLKITEVMKGSIQTIEYAFTNYDRDAVKCEVMKELGHPDYEVYHAKFEEQCGLY